MKSLTLQGIVISRKNIGEADKLLRIFTRDEGILKAVARGSRKIKSKLAGQIELFNNGTFSLVEGKTFYIITGAETANNAETISADLSKFQNYSYMAEVLCTILPEAEPYPHLFDLTLDAFEALKVTENPLIIDYFNLHVLKESGHLTDILKCVHCGKEITEENNYKGNARGIYCSNCSKGNDISLPEYKLLKLCYKGDLDKIIRLAGSSEYHEFLDKQMQPLMEDILPKKLKSKEI